MEKTREQLSFRLDNLIGWLDWHRWGLCHWRDGLRELARELSTTIRNAEGYNGTGLSAFTRWALHYWAEGATVKEAAVAARERVEL